ncbi:PREDICTED: melanotransferrin-like [Acropora digitifera]|uniref:melanotransferrin-like n=1 Tax=Acropora digitifera TaxID=70779 RepID=UPI00077A107D|nr:PREDICTED: melanotransferrin-like [Acropora digitifera]
MFASFTLFAAIVFLASGHMHTIPMRWCVLSDQEYAKCMDMENAVDKVAEELSMNVTFSCVNGTNAGDCMTKIKAGSADLVTLDGGDIKTAGMNHSLVPIVGEDYYNLPGLEGASYKAVAVVKKNNSDITFKKLKGKTSCHTGAGKTAGWNVPIGTLLRLKLMEQDESCNAYVSAGKFFYESCVPDVKDKYSAATNLCAKCPWQCSTSSGNYSGYSGAFKCMMDGAGDVAFVKHTTVGDVGADASQYEYLCKDGTRDASWEKCYLETVPAHAVMTKSGHTDNAQFKRLLLHLSTDYGRSQTNSSGFQLFVSSKYGGSDLLFKDSTKKLVDVGPKNTYRLWLGEKYLSDLEELNSCPTESSTSPTIAFGEINKPRSTVVMVSFLSAVIATFTSQ